MPTRAVPILSGYEVVARLGRGAGAVISLARDLDRNRQVVVKHVVRRGNEDEKFIAQAENEYDVAAAVEHPFLRKCYDIVRVRRWFVTREVLLIMEYVEGELLEEQPPETLPALLTTFRQIAEGLAALHQQGFAHADIKPNNVLIPRTGGVKIIDFGQSCPLGYTKERVQGTPDYIAPEQLHRQPIDQRTDVYNLGATMYRLVTGKWFRTLINLGPATGTRIALESERGNFPPHEVNPTVPLPLSKLIVECCNTQKVERPRDMKEVIARLDVVLHVIERDSALVWRPPGGDGLARR
ncbi:MAG: serine/threonine protein kinase [Phycisphaerales bacterium]|nr:serine/threonine protein kinase [Phycisphaerales bacterium]